MNAKSSCLPVFLFALASCSSGSKAAPTASASTKSAATATATSATTSAVMPETSASAAPKLACPDNAYRHESPDYCLVLDRDGRPKPPQLDGGWMTTEIGPQAVVSYSKSTTVEAATAELRKAWTADAVKAKAHYEEKPAGDKTIIRFKRWDPREDPNGAEANDVLIVIGKSGEYTVRCEIDAGMTSESVCLTMVLPPS